MKNNTHQNDKSPAGTVSQANDRSSEERIDEYVHNNREFLTRVLARGSTEAQGYVLALLQRGGSLNDIEDIQRRLENLKDEKQG